MEQLLEKLKATCLSAEQVVANGKKVVQEYNDKILNLLSRENTVTLREEAVLAREVSVKEIENVVALQEVVANRAAALDAKEAKMNSDLANASAEIVKQAAKNAADLEEIKHKNADLTRDMIAFRKEKEDYKIKVLAGITEKQLG